MFDKMSLRTLFLFLSLQLCCCIDNITPQNPLKDGHVLISKGGKFTLGFFNPGNSTQKYLGIWFTKVSVQTAVWVANRDKPVNDSRGVLSISKDGNLRVSSGKIIVWSTNISVLVYPNDTNTTTCQILDSGNLILASNDGKTIHWESFDYPTDTLLPGMKLGVDKTTGFDRYITSWRSADDPSPGNYSFRVDPNGSPQFFLYLGSDPLWRSGPWIGSRWSGVPEMTRAYIFNYSFVSNPDEISITYSILSDSITSIFLVDGFSGTVKRRTWHEDTKRWIEFWSAPKELCDQYSECGAYGSCNPNSGNQSECTCFAGYQPKSPRDWYLRDGSQGCVREENKSMCRSGEGFLKLASVKLPDTSDAVVNTSMTVKDCKEACLRNCSCMAYTSADDSRGGSGCISLYGPLVDTRLYTIGGQDVYFRADAVELAKYQKSKVSLKTKRLKAIFIMLAVLIFTSFVISMWWVHKKRKRELEEKRVRSIWTKDSEESDSDSDLPFFTRSEISAATDNFSYANKLGEGGFGSVYRGQLRNGQEIAVKKLAQNSGQGVQEFKNEVKLIAKLQHRNLVRMLGCCVQGEEKMLIYEFMPNKSLDTFIFNEEKRATLDWRTRFDIVLGIARGLLYLHQDSRLKIIHRDMKAGNVLLDIDMVPKIADFGMARIFVSDQDRANTTRVVGTYGYMAPEYALEGLISIKSDVFSFGVLLLEIITGRKNSGFYHDNPSINLIGHVWDLWNEGRALELIDPPLNNVLGDIEQEVSTCIQVGILCVQECADDRPTMSEVIFMLSNRMELPSPSRPAFIYKGSSRGDAEPSSSNTGPYSVNEMSVTATMVQGR